MLAVVGISGVPPALSVAVGPVLTGLQAALGAQIAAGGALGYAGGLLGLAVPVWYVALAMFGGVPGPWPRLRGVGGLVRRLVPRLRRAYNPGGDRRGFGGDFAPRTLDLALRLGVDIARYAETGKGATWTLLLQTGRLGSPRGTAQNPAEGSGGGGPS